MAWKTSISFFVEHHASHLAQVRISTSSATANAAGIVRPLRGPYLQLVLGKAPLRGLREASAIVCGFRKQLSMRRFSAHGGARNIIELIVRCEEGNKTITLCPNTSCIE